MAGKLRGNKQNKQTDASPQLFPQGFDEIAHDPGADAECRWKMGNHARLRGLKYRMRVETHVRRTPHGFSCWSSPVAAYICVNQACIIYILSPACLIV